MLEPLHEDAQNTPSAGADGEGWYEYTRGYLDAERDDGECSLDDECNEDGADDRHSLFWRIDDAESQVGVLATGLAFREEVVDEFRAAHTRVRIHE